MGEAMSTRTKITRPPWKVRRRIVNLTLLFCAACVLWIMVRGDDRGVNEVIVVSAFGLAFSVIGSYIFGAVWDDKNVMEKLGKEAYTEPAYPGLDGEPT